MTETQTATKCRHCNEPMPGPYRGHATYWPPEDAYKHDAEGPRVDVATKIYLQLGDSREEMMHATLICRATIADALKEIPRWRQDDQGRAEALKMTKTLKGQMFLSPSGDEVYVLKATTRTIDGMKRSMLSIKAVVPVSSVLSFEVAR
jgi:hypothetical protein